MPLRIPGLLTLVVLAMSAFVSAASVSAQPAPGVQNFGPPQQIADLRNLATYSWALSRELTGPAGQRVFDIYKDNFKSEVGMMPAKMPASGFAISWDGATENPDRFVQTFSAGKNAWTEWVVGQQSKAQYNSEPLLSFNNPPRNELMFWWDNFTDWLKANKSSLDCGTTPRQINGEQAVRCLIPTLSQEAKIGLADTLGIYAEEKTTSVTDMTFELWLTKEDTIPVELEVEVSIVDARNNKSTGSFLVDIFDIEDDTIFIDLPR
jgi:hypothetical protein